MKKVLLLACVCATLSTVGVVCAASMSKNDDCKDDGFFCPVSSINIGDQSLSLDFDEALAYSVMDGGCIPLPPEARRVLNEQLPPSYKLHSNTKETQS